MPISRNDLIAKAKPRTAEVHIESLGETVRLKRFTLGERAALFEEYNKDQSDSKLLIGMLAAGLIDEHGACMFAGPDGITLLGNLDGKVLEDIGAEISKLNGLRASDEDAKVEDAAKNSPATTIADSDTASPSPSDDSPAS